MRKPQLHIYAIAVLLAASYIATLPLLPYPAYFLVKALPCSVLALAAYWFLQGRIRIIMILALLFSAFADAAIEFEFLAGLAAFLVVQLLYCVAYYPRKTFSSGRSLGLLAIALFLIGACYLILPAADGLAVPVAMYMIVIGSMGLLAVLYNGSPLVLIGSLLFILSDTLIAINRFLLPFDTSSYFILTSYFSAQILILAGIVRTEKTSAAG